MWPDTFIIFWNCISYIYIILLSDSTEAEVMSSDDYDLDEALGEIKLHNLQCNGTESSLAHCQHSGISTHDCYYSEQVNIMCNSKKDDPVTS